MDLSRRRELTPREIEHVKGITNSGELYYDYDPLIECARNHAYEVCRRFDRNEAGTDELRRLLKRLGRNPEIDDGFITEFGFNLSIGDDFRAGRNLKVIDCNEIEIGDNVVIGDNVGIYTSSHARDPKLRAGHWCSEQPVRIGSGVVIDGNCVVLPGAVIEDDVWIRPGSVVRGRIEAGSVCAGTPAGKVEE